MAKMIIREEQFPEIVNRYNSQGKKAAYVLLRDKYGIRNPGNIIRRIKSCGRYGYDPDKDCFRDAEVNAADDVFMGLEELCGLTTVRTEPVLQEPDNNKPAAMERLVHELISDRLLAISRYITIDIADRTIIIDRTSLSADGYRILTH